MTDFSHARTAARGLVASAAVAGALLLAPAAASADPYTGTPSPRVGAADSGTGAVGASADPRGSSGGLAVTGSDVLPLTVLGFGALGAGTVLVLKNRSRRTG